MLPDRDEHKGSSGTKNGKLVVLPGWCLARSICCVLTFWGNEVKQKGTACGCDC